MNHLKKDHYLWNYMFYIAYLRDKDKTEYTGLESYIAELCDAKEISWFPTGRALCMKGVVNDENTVVVDSLKDLDDKQVKLGTIGSSIQKKIFEMEDTIRKVHQKRRQFSKQISMRSGKSNQSGNNLLNLI